MDIAIIGSGNMARGIGTRMLAGGHTVIIIDRHGEKSEALVKDLGGKAKTAPYGGDLPGEVVVLAVPYTVLTVVARDYGVKLADKIIVDITNAIHSGQAGMDPATRPGVSAAEELVNLIRPGARVVKAFNTAFAATLVKGEVAGQKLDIFVASDDLNAKKTVMELVESGGMRAIDAGPLRRALQLEGMMLLMIALQDTLGLHYQSAWKINV